MFFTQEAIVATMKTHEYLICLYLYSQLGRLRRPFARPSGVGGIEIVKIHTYRTDSQVGQTHIWDRLTSGTDSQVGQTHMWDRLT